MIAGDIIFEVGETLGLCDQTTLLRRINRAVQLLAAKDLFDPLVGYLNFSLVGLGNNIALPREVRTVLAVNINEAPAISRNRFYEFDLNTDGTVIGDSLQYAWNDRCNVCVQDERNYPGVLTYRCASADDNGCTATIVGTDETGRVIQETITGASTAMVASANTFFSIESVFRTGTQGECFLYCNGVLTGQYYGDETAPVYRSIRISQSTSNVRIMFRREPAEITTLGSYIPLNSPMAVIQAAKAVGHLMNSEDELADACLARAAAFISEDQESRRDGDKLAEDRQTAGTLGLGLTYSEGISVSDVYDPACEIFGQTGRNVIFKKITQAVQALIAKAHWDGLLGTVDIYPADQRGVINKLGKMGHAYYILPRFIGRPLKVNIGSWPLIARNRWFDFNVGGTGEKVRANIGRWDEMGDVVLSNLLPREPSTGTIIPTTLIAVCDNNLDEGASITIYGRESLNGQEVEVWRNGTKGWRCPCVSAIAGPAGDAPAWVEVERINRASTRGFVRLYNAVADPIIPGTPAVADRNVFASTDVNTSIVGGVSGVRQGFRVYMDYFTHVSGPTTILTIATYADAEMTIQLGINSQGVLSPAPPTLPVSVSFFVNGTTFTGTLTAQSNHNHEHYIFTNTFTPGTPSTPDVQNYSPGAQFGFWYPDETQPRYALIRLPSEKPKRIRVLYRKRFERILSIFEPIPLRSSLAVENMLRAIKAQELGLIEQSEPLERKAVAQLSEDRIKEGESEMPSLEFDASCSPAVTYNFT